MSARQGHSTNPGRRDDLRIALGGRILIVNDDAAVLHTLERLLLKAGFGPITVANDPRRVLPLFRDFSPDLVLLDLHMGDLDAHTLLRELMVRVPEGEFLPVVIMSGSATPDQKTDLTSLGACDFVDPRFGLADLPLRLQNVLRIRDLTAVLEQRVAARTATLRATELELANRLAVIAELCDYGDASHVQRVGRTSALIAAQLGLDPEEVQLIRHAAPLHDIGKIAIPDEILLKTDALTLEEWDILKTHTTEGARMLAGSISPILRMGEEIALYHHEQWNGTGYNGLGGEEIPLVARIVTVADVFDALTHERPYKSAWSPHDALEWMATMRDQKYDPRVFDALLAVSRFTNLAELGPDADVLIGRNFGDGISKTA
jgi:putative two-component system response regulator